MQTPERITDRAARAPHHKGGGTARSSRSIPGQKAHSTQRCCNAFLKSTFGSTVPPFIIKDSGTGSVNIITQENYNFLRDSYLRYAGLLNVKAEHNPSGSLNECITQLYYDMSTILPKKTGVNIEMDDGRLCFTLWKYHRWGSLSLYFFPVSFLMRINVELRRIAISFLHRFMHANHICAITDCDENADVLDCVLSDYEPDNADKGIWKERRRIGAYQSGYIRRLFDRIDRRCYHGDIREALDGYMPADNREKALIDAMRDGLQFLNPARPIMDYGYDPFHEEERDFHPIRLERQICMVYDTDDIVVNTLISFLNGDYEESYEILPVSTVNLSPETETVFRIEDDYPERFFQWADRFIHTLDNI
ncbi:MAG: hypothetical protein NC388_03015 [Clostridium sp.]|nr:hypothetical protein [Clostridium sp.]